MCLGINDLPGDDGECDAAIYNCVAEKVVSCGCSTCTLLCRIWCGSAAALVAYAAVSFF